MSRRRILWLAVIVAAAGAGLLALCSTAPQVVTLSDGTRLTVLRVTTSRHPKFCFGNPLQRIGSVLPGKAGEKLSGGTLLDAGSYTEPVVAIWFKIDATNQSWWSVHFMGDDDLTGSAARNVLCTTLSSGQQVGYIVAEAWPRRAKEWKLQVGRSGAWTRFRISNPMIEQCEQWKPERLPALRSAGDAEVVLLAVEVEPYSAYARNHQSYARKGFQMGTLYFQVSQSGESAETWLPAGITMQDATGNSTACVDWNPPALSSSRLFPSNTIAWSGDWPAVPGENAVKVVVDFVPRSGNVPEVLRQPPAAGAGRRSNPAPPGLHQRRQVEWIVPATGTVTNATK